MPDREEVVGRCQPRHQRFPVEEMTHDALGRGRHVDGLVEPVDHDIAGPAGIRLGKIISPGRPIDVIFADVSQRGSGPRDLDETPPSSNAAPALEQRASSDGLVRHPNHLLHSDITPGRNELEAAMCGLAAAPTGTSACCITASRSAPSANTRTAPNGAPLRPSVIGHFLATAVTVTPAVIQLARAAQAVFAIEDIASTVAYGRACVGRSSERLISISCSKRVALMRSNSKGGLDQTVRRVGVSMMVPVNPVTIKKYGNRRLYNTATSAYENLESLASMAKRGENFVVYDAKSGDDITRFVLRHIVSEEEKKSGQDLLPIAFMRG